MNINPSVEILDLCKKKSLATQPANIGLFCTWIMLTYRIILFTAYAVRFSSQNLRTIFYAAANLSRSFDRLVGFGRRRDRLETRTVAFANTGHWALWSTDIRGWTAVPMPAVTQIRAIGIISDTQTAVGGSPNFWHPRATDHHRTRHYTLLKVHCLHSPESQSSSYFTIVIQEHDTTRIVLESRRPLKSLHRRQ